MIKQDDLNQTDFSAEEPLFESAGGRTRHKKADLKKPNAGKVLIILFFTILAIGGWMYFRSSSFKTQQTENTPTSTPVIKDTETKNYVDQLFQELDENLLQADPSINIFPFPPVFEEILVSPKK